MDLFFLDGDLANLTHLRRGELTITDSYNSAMAAETIIGLRNPGVAIGKPTVL